VGERFERNAYRAAGRDIAWFNQRPHRSTRVRRALPREFPLCPENAVVVVRPGQEPIEGPGVFVELRGGVPRQARVHALPANAELALAAGVSFDPWALPVVVDQIRQPFFASRLQQERANGLH
jgi:hypothetical protein